MIYILKLIELNDSLIKQKKGNNTGRCPTTFDELVNIDEQGLTNFFPGGSFLYS